MTRNLIKMVKCWQGVHDVPLKSLVIEQLAIWFLHYYPQKTTFVGMVQTECYGRMIRDFLAYLIFHADYIVRLPRTNEKIEIGKDWKSKAESALEVAKAACAFDANKTFAPHTGVAWQEIFGTYIPN